MPVATVEPQDPLRVWDFRALAKSGSKEGLNINGGGGHTSEIKIRLRPHNIESSFFPYEHLLGTMLHELVHNVQGPHNAVFYKLLDEITEQCTGQAAVMQECEGFMAKGISGSGAGFDAPSMGRLGGRGPVPTHNPPARQLKSIALKAAEARAKKQSLMSAGPRKVGGDLSMLKSLTPAQAAARAAERRARDNVWCPCGDHGTSISYNSDKGSIVILNDVKESGQKGAECQAAPRLDSHKGDVSHLSTQAVTTAAQRLSPSRQGSDEDDLSHSSQQQRLLQRNEARSIPDASNRLPQQPVQEKLQQQSPAGQLPLSSNAGQGAAGNSELVDLTLDEPAADILLAQEPQSKRLRRQQDVKPQSSHILRHSEAVQLPRLLQAQSAVTQWECRTCTLLNQHLALQCSVCGTLKPAGFQPSQLGSGGLPGPRIQAAAQKSLSQKPLVMSRDGVWFCKFCSLSNATDASNCAACDAWRYSHGMPLASRPTI